MSLDHRKLLTISDVRNVVSSSCYLLCPPDGNNSSVDDEFSPPPPTSIHKSNMPTILILMLCVLGAVLVFLCYLTVMRRYRTNLSNSRRIFSSISRNHQGFLVENHFPTVDHPIWYIRTVGLEQSVIDSIAVFKYRKGEGLIEGTDCSVCLSEFEDDESLRLLPKCSHAFHISCIDTWLGSHTNCPLCRAPVVLDTEVNSTNIATQVNTEVTSSEDDRLDGQPESDGVGEGMAGDLGIGIENIPLSREEEDKILEMLRTNGNSTFSIGRNRIRVLSDLGDHRGRIGEEMQTVRRSFSMDLPSASVIYAAVAKIHHPVIDEGCSSFQDLEVNKQNLQIVDAKQGAKGSGMHRSRKSFTFGRSLQSVPIRMKRSFSSGGKFLIHKNSRSQELVQPL